MSRAFDRAHALSRKHGLLATQKYALQSIAYDIAQKPAGAREGAIRDAMTLIRTIQEN